MFLLYYVLELEGEEFDDDIDEKVISLLSLYKFLLCSLLRCWGRTDALYGDVVMSEEYSPNAVLDWFHRTSGVNNQPSRDEVQTTCPMCGGSKLYFNIRKQVGICHSASCIWHNKVLMRDLIDLFGFTPDQGGEWETSKLQEASVPDRVPGWPLLQIHMKQFMTTNQEALDYIRSRGIEDKIILNWHLTCDGERVYVPIKDTDGRLVNYNSRLLPNRLGPKYLYFRGAKTSHYILGWKECRDWTDLSLVENTFVSLAYRSRMFCSTTFGSNISEIQADLIAESGIRKVAILWDEGAEDGAHRALTRLGNLGVRASYWKILGQPDDYPIEWVEEKSKQIKEAADNGVPWMDFREECKKYR